MKSGTGNFFKTKSGKWFLFVVALFYLWVAYKSSGFHHLDEHYQIIEFANYKLGIAQRSGLAWEYNAQIRSGIQPFLCFLVFKLSDLIGITDPYNLAFILRAITAIFSLLVITFFVKSTIKEINEKYHLAYILLSYLLWFLPYINVRFSSEAWSGLLFIAALTIIQNEKNSRKGRNILLGAVFGLAILFRYQTAFLVLGAVLWLILIQRIKFSKVLIIALSGLSVLILGFFIDWWLYGEYTFTIYNYFVVNIIKNVASNFGVSPWYQIILYIIQSPGPIGIFILSAYIILLVRRPKHILLWASFPFLLVHTIIPHKELRFLFPVANLIPFLLILAYQELCKVINQANSKLFRWTILSILITTNIAGLIVVTTKGAGDTKVAVTEYIHRHYNNKKVNVIYIDGLNPYYDWTRLKNTFYNSRGIALTPIVTIWQDNILSKKRKGYINLLIISNNELTGPRTLTRLKKFNLIRIYQSISQVDQKIISLYKSSINDDNLIIYEFRD